MKESNKRELQQIVQKHSSGIEFEAVMKLHKNQTLP